MDRGDLITQLKITNLTTRDLTISNEELDCFTVKIQQSLPPFTIHYLERF